MWLARFVRLTFIVAVAATAALAATSVRVALATAAAPRAPGDWSQYGHGPERDSFDPDETILGRDNVSALKLRWSVAIPAGDPLVAGSVMFVTHLLHEWPGSLVQPSELDALDTATGSLIWRFSRPTAAVPHAETLQALGDGVVLVLESYPCGGLCVFHYLEALDGSTGAVRWSVRVANPNSKATVSAGTVYIGDGTEVIARSVADGSEVWRTDIGSPSTDAAVGGGRIYVTTGGRGAAMALDQATGAVLWTNDLDGYVLFWGGTYAGGIYFVGDGSPRLWALDAVTGSPIWTLASDTNGPPCIAVANGRLYFGDQLGRFMALRASDGRRVWRIRFPSSEVGSCPSIANGVIYLRKFDGQSGTITVAAIDARNGAQLWTYDAPGNVLAVSNGSVYTATIDGPGGVFAFGLSQ